MRKSSLEAPHEQMSNNRRRAVAALVATTAILASTGCRSDGRLIGTPIYTPYSLDCSSGSNQRVMSHVWTEAEAGYVHDFLTVNVTGPGNTKESVNFTHMGVTGLQEFFATPKSGSRFIPSQSVDRPDLPLYQDSLFKFRVGGSISGKPAYGFTLTCANVDLAQPHFTQATPPAVVPTPSRS